MKRTGWVLFWMLLLAPHFVSAQIDPVRRDLIQIGYNQPVQGHAPFAGYAYFYHNQPDFLRTNLTLRLSVAPVYLDSELGFVNGLGPNTDFGIGFAGGGFADNYYEIHGGTYYPAQSFDGHSAEVSASIYHLFNPASRIPLNFVLRGAVHYAAYAGNENTAPTFEVPDHDTTLSVRAGLRWGGMEPMLFPALALGVSVWYEGQLRMDPQFYGFNNDRQINSQSHLFWANAILSYTLPKSRQNFQLWLTAGTSIDADRFSAYRLGGFLPLISEFPLSLPGYYFQEISARGFVLANVNYLLPLDSRKLWNLDLNAATAFVDYLPGEGQPGNRLSGVGGGILYHTPSNQLKIMVTCAYGIDAIRSHGRGAESVGILIQWDLGRLHSKAFNAPHQFHWRGWQWLFGS